MRVRQRLSLRTISAPIGGRAACRRWVDEMDKTRRLARRGSFTPAAPCINLVGSGS